MQKEKGKRYNTGKLRHELIPIDPINYIAEVYTNGAHKYTVYVDEKGNELLGKDIPLQEVVDRKLSVKYDGADNWRRGMSWSQTIACAKRHIAAFESGEDIDPDPMMKTYHLANAAWNIIAVLEFYKTHPEFDDRKHSYLQVPKIGLDVDEVLCNFIGGWTKYHNIDVPKSWFFDRDIMNKFDKMRNDKTLDDFYLSLKPLISPDDIPFEPHCYVTSRPVDTSITEQWLDMHGFPARPVITVNTGESKVEVLKKSGVDLFLDDRFDNFVEINNAGICCYLYDSPHNQRYNVGYKRIKNLKELIK